MPDSATEMIINLAPHRLFGDTEMSQHRPLSVGRGPTM